ncbi:MAG: hypothetical protein ABI441_07380 [Flavobacterium sp.]
MTLKKFFIYILIRFGIFVLIFGGYLLYYDRFDKNDHGYHPGDVGDAGALLTILFIFISFAITFIIEMIYLSITKKESMIVFFITIVLLLLISYALLHPSPY